MVKWTLSGIQGRPQVADLFFEVHFISDPRLGHLARRSMAVSVYILCWTVENLIPAVQSRIKYVRESLTTCHRVDVRGALSCRDLAVLHILNKSADQNPAKISANQKARNFSLPLIPP